MSLPPRRYDLVGDILAAAVTRAEEGASLQQALHDVAREEGRVLGAAAGSAAADEPLTAVAQVLGSQGYQPRIDPDVVVLSNCPFDALAQKHATLVCGLNHAFVQGVVEGMGCRQVTAVLEPEPDQCCVKARTTPGSPEE